MILNRQGALFLYGSQRRPLGGPTPSFLRAAQRAAQRAAHEAVAARLAAAMEDAEAAEVHDAAIDDEAREALR